MFQVDPAFTQAVEHVRSELLKTGLPEFMVQKVIEATTVEALPDAVGRPVDDFPDANSVVNTFSTQSLDSAVLEAGNASDAKITAIQAQAIQVQLTFLRELRRHYGSRKLGRVHKIIRAAHRRAIVGSESGPVVSSLMTQVLRVLARQR